MHKCTELCTVSSFFASLQGEAGRPGMPGEKGDVGDVVGDLYHQLLPPLPTPSQHTNMHEKKNKRVIASLWICHAGLMKMM